VTYRRVHCNLNYSTLAPSLPESKMPIKPLVSAVLLVSLLLLSACAQPPVKRSAAPASTQDAMPPPSVAEESAEDAQEPSTQAAAAPAPKGPELPKIELTDRIVFDLLLAEIAGERGNIGVSLQTYLDLARRTRDPRIARRATEVALFSRNLEAATAAATLWVETDPDSIPAAQALTGILINSNQLTKVKPLLGRLLARDAENRSELVMQTSRLLARVADRDAALELAQDVLQPYSNMPEAHFALAQTALNAQNQALALAEIRKAEAMKPQWALAALLEAQILQHGSNAESIASLRNFLKANPKAREIRLTLARLLVAEKMYPEARTEFQTLQKMYPDDTEVIFAVGILSLQLNDGKQAEVNFKRLLALDFKDKDSVHLYLGQIAEDDKRYSEALAEYGQVTDGEHYILARVRSANVIAKRDKLDDARAYLQAATAHNTQERVQLILAEAQLLREANQVQTAFDYLAAMLDKMPDQPDLLYDYAMLAEKLDRVDILESSLHKLIALKPDYAHAYNALGYSLADRNVRLDEALQYIDKALQLAPDDAFIIDSMGWVQFRLGHYDDSLKYMRRAYTVRPDPDIAAHLGEVLWTVGEHDEAKRVWQDARKKSPDNEALVNTMKRFTP
jgi:tetratricopeptide (TPR) repeat protein